MFLKHHTKGIVLGGWTEGDSSKRLCLFTEEFGIISAHVQGARSLKSKMRGGCQDFSFGEFSLVRGRSGWKIVSARSQKNFYEELCGSGEKLKIAGNIFNLIKKMVSENTGQDSGSLFFVVLNFLDFLITAKENETALSECLTLMRILHLLGYMRHDPELALPLSSSEISINDLEKIAPKRSKIVRLINESLRAA